MVGGRHMGVGADHQTGAAVAENSDALLFAGGLAMEVDHDGIRSLPQRTGFEFAVDDRERIVERRHEDAADGIDHQRALAVLGVDQRCTAARRALRKIRRANEARRALDEHQRLALVPGMVAERDRVGADIEKFLVDRLGDAEAAGGVLAIDDDEIERPIADEAGQMLRENRAPGPADHVTDEKNAQDHELRKSNACASVST